MRRTVIKHHNASGTSDPLHELDALRVVLCFNRCIVSELLVSGSFTPELEAGGVEGECVLFAADVLDLYGMRLRLPVRAALAEGRVRVNVIVRLQAVIRVREVEELGSDGLGFSRHDVGTER